MHLETCWALPAKEQGFLPLLGPSHQKTSAARSRRAGSGTAMPSSQEPPVHRLSLQHQGVLPAAQMLAPAGGKQGSHKCVIAKVTREASAQEEPAASWLGAHSRQHPSKCATTYAPVHSAAYLPLRVAPQGQCRIWLGYHVLEAGLGNSFPGRHKRAGY